MTEHDKVVRVIAGLEWIEKSHLGVEGKIARETIALLKAQEPHILTLADVLHTDVVYLETHGWSDEDLHETVLRTDESKYEFSDVIVQFVDQEGCEIVCAKNRYNIEWRCWNRKPSYEQWKEKQWNE